jgi:acetyl esterase/lipase
MNAQNRFLRAFPLISVSILILSITILSNTSQIKAQPRRGTTDKSARSPKTTPTYSDVSYGPSNANKLDFWQVKSRKPAPLLVFIHGGGFRGGSKNSIPRELLTKCLEAGIACASIDYRLSGEAIYPAQMHDTARAIQFIRSKAVEWNIDPKRVAAGGGSAGSGISQWLGFHDNMASPTSDDPIARQSTRLTAVLALNMQSTYDPRQIKNIVPGNAYNHPALKQLFGLPQDWNWLEAQIDEKLDAGLKDVSPITHLTKDDPPVFILHYTAANKDGNIHHPNFGKHLKKAMDALGIECVRKMDTDFKSRNEQYAAQVQFLEKHFSIQ